MMFDERQIRATTNPTNNLELDDLQRVGDVSSGERLERRDANRQSGCKSKARKVSPLPSKVCSSSRQKHCQSFEATKSPLDHNNNNKLDRCKRNKPQNDRRMISKPATTRASNTIYSTTNNLLLDAKATKYNRNISLMRSVLVNYLKLTLCSCYDTLALATLLVFVLLLNNFIEAHQQHSQLHPNGYQTTRRLCGARTCQLYWNKNITNINRKQLATSSMVATNSARARRSVENYVLASAFDDYDNQQRPLFDLNDAIDDAPASSRVEMLLATGSEPMPLIAIEHSPLSHEHYEISRVVPSGNLSSRTSHSSMSTAITNHHHHQPLRMNRPAATRMSPVETSPESVHTITTSSRLEKTGPQYHRQILGKISNKQGSHPAGPQQVPSASQLSNTRLDLNERQPEGMAAAAGLDSVPDWSFRQAAPDHYNSARTTSTSTTTTTRRPLNRGQEMTSIRSNRPRLAIEESHWIPITRSAKNTGDLPTRTNEVVVPASSHAASALLDYPTQLGRPLRYQAGNHHHHLSMGPQAIGGATINLNTPNRHTGLHQLSSNAYGNRNPYPEFGHQHRPHYFEHANDNNHHHHHHHHHHHQLHQQRHHWSRHRRPRFQGELDNEIGPLPPPPPRPNKIYKRVLLCQKTLVSLDYIRNVDLEPWPSSSAAGGQLLNEHEINEINDNFLDLESNLDSAVSRLSSPSSSSSPTTPVVESNSSDTNTARRRSPSTNSTSTSGPTRQSASSSTNSTSSSADLERLAANETTTDQLTMRAASSLLAERRFWRDSPLSDEDPLVRCDMWDLEKGLKSRKPPEGILRMAIKADFDTVRDAINRCRQLSEKTLPPDDEYRDGLEIMSTEDLISLFSMKRGLMPGTKWCGLGDQANSYNDLGPKHRIDICCRAHDHCPIRSKPFRNDYGVLNIGLYTKSHCDCDADFYRCLREVRSRTADMLGNLYFNVMKLQCMREERLKVCREMKPIALGFERCVRYEDSPMKTVFKFTTPPVAY